VYSSKTPTATRHVFTSRDREGAESVGRVHESNHVSNQTNANRFLTNSSSTQGETRHPRDQAQRRKDPSGNDVYTVFQSGTIIRGIKMKLKVIIHQAEEGGYWAEIPAIPGCSTQGEDMRELIENVYDAVEGCLSIEMDTIELEATDQIMEIAV